MRLGCLAIVCACGRLQFDAVPDAHRDPDEDVLPDAAPCVTWGEFGAPVHIGEVGATGDDWAPHATADETQIFFYSSRAGAVGSFDVFHATRPDRDALFGTPTSLAGVNSTAVEHVPFVSQDGRTLVFGSERAGGMGGTDLWIATRADGSSVFSAPSALVSINTAFDEDAAWLSEDGLRLYFSSDRENANGEGLYLATRASTAVPFGAVTPLVGLNTSVNDRGPTLTGDELEIVWAADDGGNGDYELYRATRTSIAAPFSARAAVTTLNTGMDDLFAAFAGPDRLYLNYSTESAGGGNAEIWFTQRPCVD